MADEEAIWRKHVKDETYLFDANRQWKYRCCKTGFRLQLLDAEYFNINAQVYCGQFADDSLLLDHTLATANLTPYMSFNNELIETFKDWDEVQSERDFVVKTLLVQLARTMCINERGTLIVTNNQIPEKFKKMPEWRVTQADILIDLTLTEFFHKSCQWPDPARRDAVSVFVGQSRHTSQQRPTFLSVVETDYVLETLDGEVIIDTRKEGTPHVFTIGAGDVPMGVDLSIMGLTWEQRGFSHIDAIAAFPGEEFTNADAAVAFLDGYKSIFEPECDYKSNREFFLKQPNPNDYNSDGEQERKKNQEMRAAGIKPPRRRREDFWELGSTEKRPKFGLKQSSIDFEPYRKVYQDKSLVMRDIKLVQVYRLYSHNDFPREQWIDYFDSYREIGRRFFKIRDHCRALKIFVELEYKLSSMSGLSPELKASLTPINLNMAITYCNLGLYETALPKLEKHILRDPDNAKALYWLAKIHLHRHDSAVAEEFIQRALRIEPRNPDCLTLRKTIRSQKKDTKSFLENKLCLDLISKVDFAASRESTVESYDEDFNANLLRNFGIEQVVRKSDKEMSHMQPIREIKTATEELCQ